MRLLLLSRGGSSRLFNHGDRIICIHCFKWFEITIPFRKCVSGVEQLACNKPLPHGLEPATLKWQPQIRARRSNRLRHNWYKHIEMIGNGNDILQPL